MKSFHLGPFSVKVKNENPIGIRCLAATVSYVRAAHSSYIFIVIIIRSMHGSKELTYYGKNYL